SHRRTKAWENDTFLMVPVTDRPRNRSGDYGRFFNYPFVYVPLSGQVCVKMTCKFQFARLEAPNP
ncbi:MAG: hypothetical protein KAQ62_12595, partial [Cyclobacteriaceae bacterium]|nr:hypothetical protein [Cyclobacteriaceae bacterium]